MGKQRVPAVRVKAAEGFPEFTWLLGQMVGPIPMASIDARRQRFPEETPFAYAPHTASGERFIWDDDARAAMKDYNLLDLGI